MITQQSRYGPFSTLEEGTKNLQSLVPEVAPASELDDRFREVWPQEILNQAWESLQSSNDPSDQVYLTVLQLKAKTHSPQQLNWHQKSNSNWKEKI